MSFFRNRQRVFIGAWLAAAFMLLGFNGYLYLLPGAGTLEGNSRVMRSLQQKLTRLNLAVEKTGFVKTGKWFCAALPAQPHTSGPAPSKSDDGSGAGKETAVVHPVELPRLTGILESSDSVDGLRYVAVLNGKVCRERERIDSFTVRKIMKDKVILKGFGTQWEIRNPAPGYSSDRGR